MSKRRLPRLRIYFTALVTLAALAYLAWEHFNGGVSSHHILHRSDMPAISNWWGALLLPVLTWFITGRVQKRMALHSGGEGAASMLPATVVAGFIGSLLFGILLSAAFVNGYETIASSLFLGMVVLAVLLPVYRAECLLGFVLGMAFVFGAVIPTVVGSIVAAASAVIHLYVRPVLARLWARFRHTPPPTA